MTTAIIKPQWSPLTIALTVLGFLVFWPLGFAMLAYILWGEVFGGTNERAEHWLRKPRFWAQNWRSDTGFSRYSSGNAAFDAYREEQLKRLEQERRRLDDEVEAFREHMRNLRMARDREEFDRFMRERNTSRQGWNSPDPNQNGGGSAGF
jgi:hypothetical protein